MLEQWFAVVAAADAGEWVTTALYLIAAALAARAAGVARDARRDSEKRFWLAAAMLMAFLGLNKILDLQALLTIAGRGYARASGWYEHRRSVQYAFMLSLIGLAIVIGAATLRLTWGMARTVHVALLGLVFTGLFVLLRAASFHHLDDLLRQGPGIFRVGMMQEVVGIAVVGAAAWTYRRRPG